MEKKINIRAKKILGQMNGIVKMLDGKRECSEIIQQIIAVRSALSSIGIEIVLNDNAKCGPKKLTPEKIKKNIENIFKLS